MEQARGDDVRLVDCRQSRRATGGGGAEVAKVWTVRRVVAEILDLQPDDELLDIGCGPGAFLATKAWDARKVVGLDPSATMPRVADSKLADRLQVGTARLVTGSAAELPFGDGEFSAVTAM